MAKTCSKCGKKPSTGHNVSHSQRKTKRRYLPNIVEKKVFNVESGKAQKVKVCASCLRTMAKKQVV